MNGGIEKKEQKKAFLQSYQTLSFSIKTLGNLLVSLQEEQNQVLSVMQGDTDTDSGMEMKDVFSSLRKQLGEKNQICKIIVKNVSRMDSEIEKNILLLKYISGYTWEEISEMTNYSLRQVYNIHNLALKHFTM
ncbi:sigma-70 family RNA polymerase sigma factor [Lacrimispora amygdalina]|uniref:Sigma-70 family RNA polymerase sigma factor n=1 Tax=Lacrimispora amygdalina TaxID=253257 RepID=A0A3E2N7J9_9FIRM|nr:sigma-70 family RNA polymerase sigma factor [Clostridium indicum]RFZ76973.1 sigma-70 family RNA polymerase sigma factor [Clostridium indicum]